MNTTSLKKSLNYILYGGIATSAMDTLATGPFLISYALLFNAGNTAIGFLSAIGFVGNLMHLLSAYLLEKGKQPKQTALLFSALSRPFYLIAALLAFWAHTNWASWALLVCFATSYMIGSIAGGAWMPWMKSLIPVSLSGRFFASRFKWMMITKIVCYSMGAGIVWWFEHYQSNHIIFAYSILLSLAFAIGIYGVYTLTQVQNKTVSKCKAHKFFHKILHTLKNKPFQQLMISLSSLNFVVNFITPFMTVFMLKILGFSTSTVVILTILSQITYTYSIKQWGRCADKTNCTHILQQSIPLFMICIALFIVCLFIKTSHMILSIMIIAHLLLGISQSAITLGINNISLFYIPTDNAPVFLSVNSIFKSLAAVLGSISAGAILDTLSHTVGLLSPLPNEFVCWIIFFGISLCLFLLSFPFIRNIPLCKKQ